MRKPIYATIASPCGGAGKTTLTVMLSSYLHYRQGYRVAVVDCTGQIHCLRQMDIDAIKKSPSLQEKIKALYSTSKRAYRIEVSAVAHALDKAKELQGKDEELELILFDIPTLLSVENTCELLSRMDFVIFPFTDSILSADRTRRFVEALYELVITTGKGTIKEVYLLETMVNDNKEIPSKSKALIDEVGASLMTTRIPYSLEYGKMLYETENCIGLSTLLPCSLPMEKELAAEIDTIIRRLWEN